MPFQPSKASQIKEDFKKYVSMAIDLIHAEGTSPATIGMLKGPDPVQQVASTTVTIMQRLDTQTRESNVELQDVVKIYAAHEIVKLLAELAEAAKLYKLDDDYQLLALATATQDYVKAEAAAGHINPKALSVQMQAGIRQLPEKERKDVLAGTQNVQKIAQRYQKALKAGGI